MNPLRWTPLTFVFPARYVEFDQRWEQFDLVEWSRSEYEWTADRWNGLLDFAQTPSRSVARGRGDCEDYALVAVSWLLANGRESVGIAFCWELPYPWPTHVVAFDEERVYSSGTITDATLDEWVDHSKYDYALPRRL